MNASVPWGQLVCGLAALAALVAWARSPRALRHEGVVLPAILIYFSIGMLDFDMPLLDVWSPRLYIPPAVWNVVGVGSLAYLAGAWVGRWRAAAPATESGAPAESARAMDRLGTVLLRIGWFGLGALLLLFGSPLLTGADREHSSAYLVTLAMMVVPGGLLRVAAWGERVPWRTWVPVLASIVALLLTGYRTYTLLFALAVMVLRLVRPRPWRQRAILVAGGLVVAIAVGAAFGYWRFLRDGNASGARLVQAVVGSNQASLFRLAGAYVYVGFFREGPSILGFIVDRYPSLSPYLHGRALLGMLTSPLPGQQLDARALLSQAVYGTRQTSLVSTIFGPWYLDFGMAGVVVGLALMGYVLSRVEWHAFVRQQPVALAGYAFGLVLFTLAVHSGLSDFVFAVLIPLVFVWVARSVRSADTSRTAGQPEAARPAPPRGTSAAGLASGPR